jgi:hypothetical protein
MLHCSLYFPRELLVVRELAFDVRELAEGFADPRESVGGGSGQEP